MEMGSEEGSLGNITSVAWHEGRETNSTSQESKSSNLAGWVQIGEACKYTTESRALSTRLGNLYLVWEPRESKASIMLLETKAGGGGQLGKGD